MRLVSVTVECPYCPVRKSQIDGTEKRATKVARDAMAKHIREDHRAMTRCPGSGGVQMLDWIPGTDFPGAVVCINCSFGVQIVKGSDHAAVSMAGYAGRAGKVRVHYVSQDRERMSYRKSGV